MIAIVDLWEWLASNSDALTSLMSIFTAAVSIAAIGFAVYVAKNTPKWGFEAEYKLSIVKDELPSLLSNIRGTLNEYDSFLKGDANTFNTFDKLLDMKQTGKLEYIKIIDEKLYEDLYIVLKDIIPPLSKLISEKAELFIKVRKQWADYLSHLNTTNVNADEYSNRLWTWGQYWLWREEKAEFFEKSKNTSKYFIESTKPIIPPNASEVNNLYTIGINEVTFVKRNIDDINKKIKSTIETNIIKSIEKHIRNPFART